MTSFPAEGIKIAVARDKPLATTWKERTVFIPLFITRSHWGNLHPRLSKLVVRAVSERITASAFFVAICLLWCLLW